MGVYGREELMLKNLLIEEEKDLSLFHELYILTQIFNGKERAKIYLEVVSELTIMKFTTYLAGTVVVYKYNKKNNSREDLTHRLGRVEPELRPYRKVNFIKNLILHTSKYGEYYLKIKNIYLYKDMEMFSYLSYSQKDTLITVTHCRMETEYNGNNYLNDYLIDGLVNPKQNSKQVSRQTYYGSEYEKFIGKKYESLGFEVVYNGIKNGIYDNGIDLIVKKENQHILVQCKSWKDNKYFKINQKDIRAFIGDSYLYAIKCNLKPKSLTLHFIIADAKSITENALKLIENIDIVKFKVIPFEKS
jgi:restriction system protein